MHELCEHCNDGLSLQGRIIHPEMKNVFTHPHIVGGDSKRGLKWCKNDHINPQSYCCSQIY